MNFDDTPQEAAFRETARQWIDANAPKELVGELSASSLGRIRLKHADIVEVGKAWQKKKFDAGWACLHWPKEYGGRGATPIERVIWQQEEGVYGKLTQPFQIGEGMCGPTVMAYGSEADKRRYLPKLASGEEIWCQLFSEPAGGSDVAGLRTRAEKRGDDWVINGQKIWTSGAHYSDYGLLITRTDPNVPKHKGLTMFFLDMKSQGVEVRPIKQANGMQEFNEVYFTDVVIPDSQRLGNVGDGWNVSLTTLMNERMSIGSRLATGFPEIFAFCSESDDRERACDRRSCDALEARILGGEGERAEIHQLSRHLGAVARANVRARRTRSASWSPAPCCRTSRPMRWTWRARPACSRAATRRRRRASSSRCCSRRPRCGSPVAPTRSCATSSPNACSGCPAISASTRTCRSTRCRQRDGADPHPDALRSSVSWAMLRIVRNTALFGAMSRGSRVGVLGPAREASNLNNWFRLSIKFYRLR